MSTRDLIIEVADNLIRDKGFNAFSFYDISKSIGIKTASIHYHFPTKADLAIATIKEQIKRFEALKEKTKRQSPQLKLEAFLSVYSNLKAENKVCMVGSLATDINSVDGEIKKELAILADYVLAWVIEILEEGKQKQVFSFSVPVRTKALLIITNMLGIVQVARLSSQDDFLAVKNEIINDLTSKKL